MHSPPEARVGKEVVFRAAIRAPGGVYGPEVLWRPVGSTRWIRIPMRAEGEDWVAVLPARDVPKDALEYYIGAYERTTLDEGDWRSRQDPQRLQVAPASIAGGSSSGSDQGSAAQEPRTKPPATVTGRSLFLRAGLDAAVLTFSGHLRANENFTSEIDMSSTGAAVGFDLAAGGFVSDDLALAASFWNAYALSPSLSPPPPAQDAKYSVFGLGPQLVYYLSDDVSASAMAGLCGAYLNADAGEVHLNEVFGFGARVSITKEWQVRDRWAAGVGAQITYARVPGGEAGRPENLSSWLFGVRLSASHR